MKRLRHGIEYALMRAGLALVDRLSFPSARRMGICIADIWYACDLPRRRLAIQNILQSRICSDVQEARRVARASFRYFALVVTESLKAVDIINESNWREHVTLNISPPLLDILNDPSRGLILATGHFGSWEIAGHLLSCLKPVLGVARPMNNPLTEQIMQERRPRDRFQLTPKHDEDTNRFLEALKQGNILALMIDQHARDRGMMVNFFGRPASTHTSIALLHLVTQTPLSFGYCLRTGDMSFELTASGPFSYKPTGDKEEDIRMILGDLTHKLEEVIAEHPEQYLWAHRRWR